MKRYGLVGGLHPPTNYRSPTLHKLGYPGNGRRVFKSIKYEIRYRIWQVNDLIYSISNIHKEWEEMVVREYGKSPTVIKI